MSRLKVLKNEKKVFFPSSFSTGYKNKKNAQNIKSITNQITRSTNFSGFLLFPLKKKEISSNPLFIFTVILSIEVLDISLILAMDVLPIDVNVDTGLERGISLYA